MELGGQKGDFCIVFDYRVYAEAAGAGRRTWEF